MKSEKPITVNEMIIVLQNLQKEGKGELKLIHSFNTIHELSIMKTPEENFLLLKGFNNSDDTN